MDSKHQSNLDNQPRS